MSTPSAVMASGSRLFGEWTRVTRHAAFSPRDTAEGVVFDGRMWLSNAYHNGHVLVRDLWRSRNGADWECVLERTPYDGYSEMTAFGDHVWAVKGSVWRSGDGVNWERVLDKTPFGVRGYGELVVHHDAMWQLGRGRDVWTSTDGVTWRCAVTEAPFGPRYAAGVASFDGSLWLLGGAVTQPSTPPEKHYSRFTTGNDVWRSNDGVRWKRVLQHAPWAPRMWFSTIVFADRLWVIGGFSNRESINFADAWSTTDGVHWTPLEAPTWWSPRHEPTCYVFEDSLWLVAGNSWPLMNDVWRLELTTRER